MRNNTTGLPDTRDYNLGRGIVYVSLLNTAGRPVSFRDMGNATEFNINVESETLEHRSSRSGLADVDKEVELSRAMTLSVTFDELNLQNVADFLAGEIATHTNVAVAGFAEWEMVPAGTLVAGRWYDIKNSSHNRAYDVRTADITVKTTNGTPVTLALNTDYTVDTEMGRIFILSTSAAVATAVTAGEGLDVTLAAYVSARGVDEVRALSKTTARVAIKFIAENPADDGSKTEFNFHAVTLKAEGDFGLISDEWTTMQFTGKAEKNTQASSTSPTLTIRKVRPAA